MKQVLDRGFAEAGIRVIGTGDALDDEQLNAIGDGALGMITSYNYSAAHDSPENKAFVAAFRKANPNLRPNVVGVSGYDGLHAFYSALEKTGGDTNGDRLMEGFKGLSWTSPRGPISIDPQTRDIVQNIYIRKVEKKDGELWHMEFATFPDQKNP
jgi:branched-chain amino acid transport system substrate-binding protein